MLEVEHYELIRRKHDREGMSQREIARELGHSRKTVAKALKERIPPGYRLSEPRPRPVIEPVRHIIDAWLEQNKKARRKQRQTAKRIYERLRDEYGFKGHYGTVQRHIKRAAGRQKEVFMHCSLSRARRLRLTGTKAGLLTMVPSVRLSFSV